jgi:predicted component of type VI protein secretion system
MLAVETPFELVVVGPGVDARYPLSRRAMTIGRSRAATPDIEIADGEAAPRHCIIQWNAAAGLHELRVFGAAGAWLNGTLMPGDGAVHPLTPGDAFRIGLTTFTYRSTAAAAADADENAAVEDAAVEVPTVHAAPTSRDVYEFEVIPRLAGGAFDWKDPLVSYGPRRRTEAPMQAVRVVITKGTPRAAVIAALKQIVNLVEASAATDYFPAG